MNNNAILRQAGLVDPTKLQICLKSLISIAFGGAAGVLITYLQQLMTDGTFTWPQFKIVLMHAFAGALVALIGHFMQSPLTPVPPN